MAPAPSLQDLIATVDDRSPGDDPLTKLGAAVELAGELGNTADALLNHFVETARASGASWTQIGTAIGVTKQGAQQRFVDRRIQVDLLPHMKKMTARARNSLNAAVKEARHHGHGYVGTEHLLLGLLHEPKGLAVRAMEAPGHTVDEIRAAVEERMPSGQSSSTEEPPLTPLARRALDLTLGEALRLGHNYVGTEHLLLGLLKDEEGLGARVLAELGVTHAAANTTVIQLLVAHMKA